MRVYLDLCCLSRFTDDQSQPRIRDEAESIARIFAGIHEGSIHWIASDVLSEELNRDPRAERRLYVASLLVFASETVGVNDEVASRAKQLHSEGYGVFDSLHLACAEHSQADVLLTTDDRFVKKANRGDGKPAVLVRNPLSWNQKELL